MQAGTINQGGEGRGSSSVMEEGEGEEQREAARKEAWEGKAKRAEGRWISRHMENKNEPYEKRERKYKRKGEPHLSPVKSISPLYRWCVNDQQWCMSVYTPLLPPLPPLVNLPSSFLSPPSFSNTLLPFPSHKLLVLSLSSYVFIFFLNFLPCSSLLLCSFSFLHFSLPSPFPFILQSS